MHTIIFEVKDLEVFSNKNIKITRETAEKLHKKLVEKGINDMSETVIETLTNNESSEIFFVFNDEKKLLIAKELLKDL